MTFYNKLGIEADATPDDICEQCGAIIDRQKAVCTKGGLMSVQGQKHQMSNIPMWFCSINHLHDWTRSLMAPPKPSK